MTIKKIEAVYNFQLPRLIFPTCYFPKTIGWTCSIEVGFDNSSLSLHHPSNWFHLISAKAKFFSRWADIAAKCSCFRFLSILKFIIFQRLLILIKVFFGILPFIHKHCRNQLMYVRLIKATLFDGKKISVLVPLFAYLMSILVNNVNNNKI